MEKILVLVLIIFAYIIAAIAHEGDLSRNFKKTGDAKAWFFEIKK